MRKEYSQILTLSKAYLSEMRKRFLFCLAFFLIIFFISFIFSEKIFKIFLDNFQLKNVQIITTSPFQFFGLSINMALAMAIVLSFPVVIYNLSSFLSPALTKKERRNIKKIFFLSLIFFIVGFLFGFGVLDYVLIILAEYNTKVGLVNMWDIRIFVSQIFLTAALMGIIFQFPIIISILIKKNIINVKALKKKRKFIIVSAFIIAALLPPTDGLSLIIMGLFLILIFELTLFYNRKAISKNL
jgi:sec-independent protein translocase protein TatC